MKPSIPAKQRTIGQRQINVVGMTLQHFTATLQIYPSLQERVVVWHIFQNQVPVPTTYSNNQAYSEKQVAIVYFTPKLCYLLHKSFLGLFGSLFCFFTMKLFPPHFQI